VCNAKSRINYLKSRVWRWHMDLSVWTRGTQETETSPRQLIPQLPQLRNGKKSGSASTFLVRKTQTSVKATKFLQLAYPTLVINLFKNFWIRIVIQSASKSNSSLLVRHPTSPKISTRICRYFIVVEIPVSVLWSGPPPKSNQPVPVMHPTHQN